MNPLLRPAPLFALLGLLGCSRQPGPGGTGLESVAEASLVDARGQRVGVATFSRGEGRATLGVSVSGLAPGSHGIHLHESGRCDPPDFKSAGGHYNPENRRHGLRNPEGPHAGDLPNLNVGEDGSADTVFALDPQLLAPGDAPLLAAPDGSALVVHAGPDDQLSDPAGNSGDRVACGVIEPR